MATPTPSMSTLRTATSATQQQQQQQHDASDNAPDSSRRKDDTHSQLAFIREPLHNMREIAKQLLCLEDHLCCVDRRCQDCIRKHLLYTEALAEEGAAMDMTGEYRDYLNKLARSLRGMELKLFGDEKLAALGALGGDPNKLKQILRTHRKYIVNQYGNSWVSMYAAK